MSSRGAELGEAGIVTRRDYPRCNAKRRQVPEEWDGPEPPRCTLAAGWGVPGAAGVAGMPCKLHGGATPNMKVHLTALRVERDAANALDELRRGPIVSPSRASPAEVLLSTVTEQAILVAYLRRRIETEVGERWVADVMGATSRGDLYEVSEEERVLVRMYRDSLQDLNRMSKAAHEAGVQEAVLKIEEDKWRYVVGALIEALRASDISPQQQQFIRKHIAAKMNADQAAEATRRGATPQPGYVT